MNEESLNVAVLRGVCSSPADVRVLPSEEVLAQLQVTTRVDGKARSVPVAVWNPAAWIEQLDAGDEIVVIGSVNRRFFRAAGATASRVEVEADTVVRARDGRRMATVRRRVADALDALDE
jgi:single-strand DNA-binding protein